MTDAEAHIDLPPVSAPAGRALAGTGVAYLHDLTRYTRKQIAGLHGVGPKALRILNEALRDAGLEFAPDT